MNILESMKAVLAPDNYEKIYLSNGSDPGVYFDYSTMKSILEKTGRNSGYRWRYYIDIAGALEHLGYKTSTGSNFGKDIIYFDSVLQRSRFLAAIGYPEAERNAQEKAEKAKRAKERRELLKSGKKTYRQFQSEIKKAIEEEELFSVYKKTENTHDCRNLRCINEVGVTDGRFAIKIPDGKNKVYEVDDFISVEDFRKAQRYVSGFVNIYI